MSASGTPAAATPAPAAGGVPDPGGAPAAAAAASFDWSKQGLDADSSSYVTAKGWKTPGDLVASYRGAERLLSVPPDQVIKLPQGEFNQQVWTEQVYDRLGRPKDVAGYELGKLVPAGADPKFAEAAAGWFHEAGLNPRQAQALAGKWNEHVKGLTTTTDTARQAKDVAEVSALKAEWGQAFDSNAAVVDRAAAQFGMAKEQVDALKQAMGPKGAMTFLFNIGQKMGVSDTFVRPDGGTNVYGSMTPDAAKQELETLKRDKGFMDKYFKGDVDAKKRMTELHARAHPGTLTL